MLGFSGLPNADSTAGSTSRRRELSASHRFGSVIDGLSIDYSRYVFIDIGSGMGRALLMASEFPFKQLVGIELSPTFHQIAQQNVQ